LNIEFPRSIKEETCVAHQKKHYPDKKQKEANSMQRILINIMSA
jgi:hypothetical protein